MENVKLSISPELYLTQINLLKKEIIKRDEIISKLEIQLEYERSLREKASSETPKCEKKRKKIPEIREKSEYKSDGKRKAHAADSIRSYDDFKAIQDYYWNKGRIRDWTMWTVGVSLGLRISDLLSLKFCNFLEKDGKTFKNRLEVIEQKTGKLNSMLITDSVRYALQTYLEAIKDDFDLDGYLFPSKKTKSKMYEECGWRILSEAGKRLGLPLVIGSHTMRKSFANIAACVDKSTVDMNSITKVQGLLNHSDQRVTMKYLGTYQDMYDRARIAVSDFVLGKSNVNEIIAGNQYSTDDVVERLDALERILIEKKGLEDA